LISQNDVHDNQFKNQTIPGMQSFYYN